jgi:single-strand DNA-binding protein
MANDLNRCEFIGRLGRDPESRFTPDGMQIVSFSIAVGRKYKDKEETEWVNIVAFGKLAEICAEYLSRGKQIYVAGRLNTQKYQDKETGQDRYSTRVIADQMQMLGGRDDDGGQREAPPQSSQPAQRDRPSPQQPQQSAGGIADMSDDIPFMRAGHGASWRCI